MRKILSKFSFNDLSNRYSNNKLQQLISFSGQPASDVIQELLMSNKPVLIARFGGTEIGVVRELKKKKVDDEINIYSEAIQLLLQHGGFYPATKSALLGFRDIYIDLMKDIDVLGSWWVAELSFIKELRNVLRVRLEDLEPYIHDKPWTIALRGKKILVVHPFIKSITSQFARNDTLFENKDVLPDFDLVTYRSIYEFNIEERRHASWLDALNFMTTEILSLDFDIAILGCGPFGLPIGQRIKHTGRSAIVLGGATQILFGIKGLRWNDNKIISKLYNDNWVYPLPEETPKGSSRLEGNCYWGPSNEMCEK